MSDATTPPQPSIVLPTPTPATPQTAAPTAQTAPTPVQITIDEFMKIQLKTAKVISAERVPKSEKLLKLQVSLGTEQRQIVAGIGKMPYQRFLPFDILGGFIWLTSLTYAGYAFGNIPWVKQNLTLVILGIIFLSILPGIIETLRHRATARS